jgi:hypothetical protein
LTSSHKCALARQSKFKSCGGIHINFLLCDWPALRQRWRESLSDEPLTDEQKRQAFKEWILKEGKPDD